MAVWTYAAANCGFSVAYTAPNNGQIAFEAGVPFAIFHDTAGVNVLSGPYSAAYELTSGGWHPTVVFTVTDGTLAEQSPPRVLPVQIVNRSGAALHTGRAHWAAQHGIEVPPTIVDAAQFQVSTPAGEQARGSIRYDLGDERVVLFFDAPRGGVADARGVVLAPNKMPSQRFSVDAIYKDGANGGFTFVIDKR
jgi:hypothetical protein